MEGLFGTSVGEVLRVLLAGIFGYMSLVAVLRITGNRTLSKLNAFDFIVTVALGSALATTMLSKSTSLVEGVAGMVLLVALQYAVTWTSVRWPAFEATLKSEPCLLVHQGTMLKDQMRAARITEDEIHAAAREQGRQSLTPDISVVLETNGSLSILHPS
jgi:uncharacterized membrane protein YcaP (DUF421 family)